MRDNEPHLATRVRPKAARSSAPTVSSQSDIGTKARTICIVATSNVSAVGTATICPSTYPITPGMASERAHEGA